MAFFFFFDKLQEIEDLQNQIEQHGKIAQDILRKINYKFRLEWNYHSNAMEGNTLTMQETRSIMIGNITVDGKPIKDVMEMKGHDDVISTILKIGKGELNISEKRIKEIHRGIMHEDDPDKQPQIGKWKTGPNYVINYKGERFDFTAPGDVHDAMHKLTDWLNAQREKISRKEKDALHPIQLAFHFHIDYVTIHPFYDGNGRTARILTNLILISYGYPPVYIKKEEETQYHQYLGEIQTYGADTELFYDFMAGLLIRSQRLVVDALEGREIDEANDWQKKLQLLKIEKNKDDVRVTRSDESVRETIDDVISPFLKQLIDGLQNFEDFFSSKSIEIRTDDKKGPHRFNTSSEVDQAISFFRHISTDPSPFSNSQQIFYPIDTINFNYSLSGFKRDRLNTFGINLDLKWTFTTYKYSLSIDYNNDNAIEKLYHERYSNEEIDSIINKIGNLLYSTMENRIKK